MDAATCIVEGLVALSEAELPTRHLPDMPRGNLNARQIYSYTAEWATTVRRLHSKMNDAGEIVSRLRQLPSIPKATIGV